MTIDFVERETLGSAWSIEVHQSGVIIGHIRRSSSSGAFRYFRGAHNELTPSHEENDLEILKRCIRDHP